MTKPAPVTLETATHANQYGYSEIYPFEIVRVISDKTVEIRRMKHLKDPAWKPDIHPGGFAGHCSNQNQQTWLYESDERAPVIRMRKVKPSHQGKMCTWKSAMGFHRLETAPRYFYDYNF